MTDKNIERANIFKALGDPKRIMILDMLSGGELCVCKILERFDMAQSTLSHHMRILSKSGLVTGRNEGKWTYYSLDPAGFNRAKRILEILYPMGGSKRESLMEVKDGNI